MAAHFLSGCSAARAMHSTPGPDLSTLRVGASRATVESTFGPGAPIERDSEGLERVRYVLPVGREANTGRPTCAMVAPESVKPKSPSV